MHLVDDRQEFRDSLSTVTKEGKRIWIYPRKPGGKFHNARIVFSIILLAVLFIVPFIKINNNPLFLFNFIDRNFIFFGIPFGPHDFYLFMLGMIAFVVFIFLFTAVFGRVFCGWVCPQTVFMEMVFRKIEYWLEGDAASQKKLNSMPWNSRKIFRKYFKWTLFFAVSFIIANTLMAWIIGVDETFSYIAASPSEHISSFIAILGFTFIFYIIFSTFREQACTIVCPYGRLQGVLLDKNSLVIAYDHTRGEPRGKINKNQKSSLGDCVDCYLCVDVCPTGIDIRNGTQLECVNCTACIDVCDSVMLKTKRPKGLIRYASVNSIENKIGFKITPRIIIYSILFILLLSILTFFTINRKDVAVTILRTPGMLFQEQPDNRISNLYSLNLVNKTFNSMPIQMKLNNINGEIKILGSELEILPNGIIDSKFMIMLNKKDLKLMNTPLDITVFSGDKVIDIIRTSFLGPKTE